MSKRKNLRVCDYAATIPLEKVITVECVQCKVEQGVMCKGIDRDGVPFPYENYVHLARYQRYVFVNHTPVFRQRV